ncbi:MAG TPA: ATP-grasp domain-containing protein [Methylomirabilota bacterium]
MRILIAGLTTRALAESAVRAGATVVTVDYFGDLDQARLCETHSLRARGRGYSAAAIGEVAREVPYDAVVYCGGLENHPAVVAELARDRLLLGNAPDVLRRVREPRELFRYLAGRGFAVPDTRFADDRLPGTGEWLLKPARGGGGQGVRVWAGQRPGPTQILQELVEGVSASASFAADGRRSILLGWTEQRHVPRGFRYAGNVMPLDGGASARDETAAIADALTAEYGLRGLNGFDFVLRGSRPVVLEVNPRYCASMELIEGAGGPSVFGLHLAACRGELPARPAEPPGVWGKAIVYAPRAVAVPDTTEWLGWGVRDVPHPGEIIRAGHPICTVLASGPTRALCERALGTESARVLGACRPVDHPSAAGEDPEDDE